MSSAEATAEREHRRAHGVLAGLQPEQGEGGTPRDGPLLLVAKARVAALVGPVAARMWVSTFHSACVRILRRESKALGYPSSFTIYDEADALRLTSNVLRDANVDPKRFPPRGVRATISAAKNELVLADEYSERARAPYERRGGAAYPGDQAPPQAGGALGFRDPPTGGGGPF